MSQIEFGKPSSAFAYTFSALDGSGEAVSVAQTNFFPATSQIVGLSRVTSGGTPAQPRVKSISAGTGAGGAVITIQSAVGDTSVYTLYWTNKVDSGLLNC